MTPMRDRKQEAEELSKQIVRFVNSYDESQFAIIAEEIANAHRTLQGSAVRLLIKIMARLAENGTDLRNQEAVRFCKDCSAIADERFIPFI